MVAPSSDVLHQEQSSDLLIDAQDVVVTYDVYEDRGRTSLKEFVARLGRRRVEAHVHAVRGVSFQLHEGGSLGLIGVNGSGKSSLLRAVAGLLPINDGRILVQTQPVLLGVGAALQPNLSGRRNILLGGTAMGLSRAEVDAKCDDIVEFAGLAHAIERPVRTYSSGMSARLRFAIATAIEPRILLVDEALAVGDATFKAKSEARMRGVVEAAGGLIVVSHSLATVRRLCSTALWIHEGRRECYGDVETVVSAYEDFVQSQTSR